MFRIAKWYNNFQAPVVLMIDDLSDAYIDVYEETYKNDWGYLCNTKGSSFDFLSKNLLEKFSKVKITFFTPYLKHNVINENSNYDYKKYSIGDRDKFTSFLKELNSLGHEIAHHGSDHGQYINKNIASTFNNWIHEWALFKDVDTGVKITYDGVKKFKDVCAIDVVGGKYCGYVAIDNSQEIIDKCNFLYWCDKPSYNIGEYKESFFGKNNVISFPTNFAGNSFVRLTYLSGDQRRDKKKKILKYLQPIYSMYSYFKLYSLYKKRYIISIQEHNSPSTSAGTVQSANIITDIKSLNKIFSFLSPLSIWYATCKEISKYIYARENSNLFLKNNRLIINFKNPRNLSGIILTLVSKEKIVLIKNGKKFIPSKIKKYYVLNLPIDSEKNIFTLSYDILE